MKKPLHALVLLFAAACAAKAPAATGPLVMAPDTALDDTLVIPFGQSAETRDRTVRVTFRSRLRDSRCAANVVCVWAGDAGVGLRTETAHSSTDGDVHTAVEPRILWAGQHQVSLLDLTPRAGEPNQKGPIAATVRVVRLGK